MNYEIKAINTHYIAGQFIIIGVQVGWSISPVMYKNQKYVVEIKIDADVLRKEDLKVFCYIYEYVEEKKILKKHRGELLFKDDVSVLILNDNTVINMYNINDAEFEMYLPQIMEKIMENIFM